LESVFTNDSLQFVYKLDHGDIVKQIVDLGDANENYVLINDGLKEGDIIYLSTPEETNETFAGLDIYKRQLKEKEEKKAAEEKAKEEFEKKPKKPKLPPGVTPEMMKKMQAKSTSKK
ncbi:MAG TPA: hypothetical protein VKA27_18160, partial [Sunxiuqinia sp.]|nr:hypothetical protein [Sunxiuqinia sp.]